MSRQTDSCVQGHVPLMELPPLSPGIQARVMEEAEVVETVRRGWSGGTEEETQRLNSPILLVPSRHITNEQLDSVSLIKKTNVEKRLFFYSSTTS